MWYNGVTDHASRSERTVTKSKGVVADCLVPLQYGMMRVVETGQIECK